jgi:ketosteroid isomerase-like protein
MDRIFAGVGWWNQRDAERMVAECHPDVEFKTSIALVEGDAGVYRGLNAIRQWLATIDEAFGELRAVIEQLWEIDPDTFLGSGRMQGRGLGSDAPFDLAFFWVVRQRDGLLWRWEGHLNEEGALASLGLDRWPGEPGYSPSTLTTSRLGRRPSNSQ